MKFTKKRVGLAAVILGVIVAAVVAVGGPSQAAALITGRQIAPQTIESRNIAEGGVGYSEVRNGSLTGTDMNPNTVKRFLADTKGMTQAEKDSYALKSEVPDPIDPVFSVGNETTVADMGGSWGTFAAPRATQIDTVSLEAGEYLLNAEGIMSTLGADADGFFGQIAVRSVDGTTWGKDLGTCFTADFGTQANREASCSTTRVVEFSEQTEVKVFAFGYQRDGQGGVSNAVKAKSFLTATPVTD